MIEVHQKGLFDRSQRDAVAVDRANRSRKFSLRYDDRRHESVDSLFSIRIIEIVELMITLS